MNRSIQRINILCLIAIVLVGTSVTPSINATFFTKSADITQNSTAFPLENIRVTVQNDEDLITIQYWLHDFSMEDIIIGGVGYYQIRLGEESNIMIKGKPELPNICRSIIIPDDLKMDIRVISSSYDEYDGILVSPSKGDLLRCVNPEEIPYEFDEIYNENIWFPGELAELEKPYILRDFRGQVVKINPFQYNPAKEKLRFYTDITVEIYPTGFDTINCISRPDLPSSIDSEYSQIYERHFINMDRDRYDSVEEQGNMLIITYDDFWDAMIPFYEWKNLKGIPTEMIHVSEIGDAAAIRTYISDYYNDYGLTFVLLVGDSNEIPSLYTSPYTSSASDVSYSFIVGSDNYQDLFVGRFSAENVQDVETQVERSIEYEREPQVDAEWYHKGTGVASNQGPGDDNEYDDEHMDFIRDDLLAYTYTEVDQIYDPSATSTMVSDALNEGRSIVNYCGHGSITSWGSSGFSNTHINSLTNDNTLPFICCVACNNGEFDSQTTCFAEAWLRATNNGNGEPTGAIGCFASTQSQSWDPPMDAEDEMIDILIESHDNNIRTTYGALCFEGTMHMMDEYGTSCYDETDSWTVFGDPSLQVRTDIPAEMTVTHDSHMNVTTWSLEVEVEGVEGALCAISRYNELFGSAYTDENGFALVQIVKPEGLEPLDLIVTGYNKIMYTAEILVNSAPEKPETPSGPASGKPGVEYLFSTVTTDIDGDRILYNFSWGDGTYSGWVGPSNSGEMACAKKTWDEQGTYEVKVKAKDSQGQETDWSDPMEVIMPKSFEFLNIIEQLFPRLFTILEFILNN